MGRVLAGCSGPVVTTGAATGHFTVIEYSARPAAGVMAVVAGISRVDVGRIFTGGGGAVMAGGTAPNDGRMVNPGDLHPGKGGMTVFTVIVGRDVIHW